MMTQGTWEFRCLFDMLTFHWGHTQGQVAVSHEFCLYQEFPTVCLLHCVPVYTPTQCARAPGLHIFMSAVILVFSILLNEVALV